MMRIIHISDLHFGMHRANLIEYFLTDLTEINPDVIVISGDLTQRALTEQYRLLQSFLKRLPVQALIVPGNHDIPFYSPLIRLFNPFKQYKKYVSSELTSAFANEKLNILGVNSVTPYKIKDGKLSEETIQRIKTHFKAIDGRLNILFFHHNLNYFSGMHHPLNNAPEFIDYLKESPIHIVCTGHLHYANVTVITKKTLPHLCAILHAGTLLCQRSKDGFNSYYVIEVDGLQCKIDLRVFNNNSFISQKIHDINFG